MQNIERDAAISRGYSAGNYANAYETTDLETALDALNEDDSLDGYDDDSVRAYRIAFVLGFFGSYELSEIGSDERDRFDECYWSDIGAIVREHGYCDSRDEDYRQECA